MRVDQDPDRSKLYFELKKVLNLNENSLNIGGIFETD